eukprot:maker-scaffold_5-snap-gene-19.7-mRNA-1 protein AED:0.04 eAED:0.04 QI:131/1/1/1/1/1/5/52/381
MIQQSKLPNEASPLISNPNHHFYKRRYSETSDNRRSTVIEPPLSLHPDLWSNDDFLVWGMVITSLIANITLFTAKIYVFVTSQSLAVLASAVDSLLDLVSQLIVYYALNGTRDINKSEYPVGKSRLEPVGIVVCAALMAMAALQVVYSSFIRLYEGFSDASKIQVPEITTGIVILLTSAIFIKLVLFIVCYKNRDRAHSLIVLYEDHYNDVLSNFAALVTAYFCQYDGDKLWYLDPIGAICISIYISQSWTQIANEQIDYLVGKTADPSFLDRIRRTGNKFHQDLEVDIIRAYHFGKRYLVEVEIVLPWNMSVKESHDIALGFQKLIEEADEVERAFVHVDYTTREEDEHKNLISPSRAASRQDSKLSEDFPDEPDIEIKG